MDVPPFTPVKNMVYFHIVTENREKQKEFFHA